MSKQRKTYSAQQKIAILKEHLLGGVRGTEICRNHGIHPSTLYEWKQQLFRAAFYAFSKGKRDASAQEDGERIPEKRDVERRYDPLKDGHLFQLTPEFFNELAQKAVPYATGTESAQGNRMTSTGIGHCLITLLAILPIRTSAMTPRPWMPMTTRSQFCSTAVSTIISAGAPCLIKISSVAKVWSSSTVFASSENAWRTSFMATLSLFLPMS